MDNDSPDTFDDLFEPFGLEGRPSDEEGGRPATVPVGTSDPTPSRGTVTCASCGNPNDPSNRHCERCGARLVRSQMPVAPQPMLRTTAGARALIVLAGVILFVALLALAFNAFSGGGDEVAATSTTTGTTAATTPITQLTPFRIECKTSDGTPAELVSFPCSALIDGDPGTSWNAPEGGIGVEITFFFSPPVQITEMNIENVTDEGRFLRNRRIEGYEVTIDDLQQTTVGELPDSNDEPHRIEIRSLRTSSVTLRITSAYPGQSYEGQEPFSELAAQDITFWGRPTPGG